VRLGFLAVASRPTYEGGKIAPVFSPVRAAVAHFLPGPEAMEGIAS